MKKKVTTTSIRFTRSAENGKMKPIQSVREKKIARGAKDFAVRFETVMKELANG